MHTVLPSERPGVAHARRGPSSRPARSRESRPAAPRNAPPTRRPPRRSVEEDRRRLLRACVVAFVLLLAAAFVLLLALRDAPGALAFLPSFVATYLACAAWLAATVVMMRRASRSALTAWAVGGAALLVVAFVAQVVVA